VLIDKKVNTDPRFGRKAEWLGAKELRELNIHFSKFGRLIGEIRDNLAFHAYDKGGLIEASFQAIPHNDRREIYLSDTSTNSFFFASELCVAKALVDLSAAGKMPTTQDFKAGLEEVLDAAFFAARLFSAFVPALMIESMPDIGKDGIEEVEIGPSAKMSNFYLPFFFDEDDVKQFHARKTDQR
jgi:hypothetical protein